MMCCAMRRNPSRGIVGFIILQLSVQLSYDMASWHCSQARSNYCDTKLNHYLYAERVVIFQAN
jgi:hypothetical protein